MKLNIAVLAGDGIGPEVSDQAIKALNAIALEFDHKFSFNNAKVGGASIDECGDPFPQRTLELCKTSDAILFGAIGDPKYDNAEVRPEQGLLKMRKELGLFANIRPVKAFDS
jgi:3-isopropylmalate dehydrogenase